MNTNTDLSKLETVKVDLEDGIAWVTLNRPEKRNAMNPALNREMMHVLEALEVEDSVKVLVITGAGEAFTAGMDLKEYFRETQHLPPARVAAVRREASVWQWRKLMYYSKPTIAMVNGWCFGGAFTPLVACDLSIAAEEATFGLSEINWGIIPAGNVTKAAGVAMNHRDCLYYIMTGEPFDGIKAAAMGLVNEAVPLSQLRTRTSALAKVLMQKNPTVLYAAKMAFKHVGDMSWETSEDYLASKAAWARMNDAEGGNQKGLTQFLDDKSFRPGLGSYERGDK